MAVSGACVWAGECQAWSLGGRVGGWADRRGHQRKRRARLYCRHRRRAGHCRRAQTGGGSGSLHPQGSANAGRGDPLWTRAAAVVIGGFPQAPTRRCRPPASAVPAVPPLWPQRETRCRPASTHDGVSTRPSSAGAARSLQDLRGLVTAWVAPDEAPHARRRGGERAAVAAGRHAPHGQTRPRLGALGLARTPGATPEPASHSLVQGRGENLLRSDDWGQDSLRSSLGQAAICKVC